MGIWWFNCAPAWYTGPARRVEAMTVATGEKKPGRSLVFFKY
jgi:hypothetical protein